MTQSTIIMRQGRDGFKQFGDDLSQDSTDIFQIIGFLDDD